MPTARRRQHKKLGRPDDRRQEIEAILRDRIAVGKWPPAGRIPTRLELCAEFRTGPTTIQRVLTNLAADGCIQARGRNGTFVSDMPPHLANVAVVFPEPQLRSGYFDALAEVARRPRTDALRVRVYVDVNQHLDSADCRELLEDIRHRRIMGIFFSTPPFLVEQTPIVTSPGIARCVVMDPKPEVAAMSTLNFGDYIGQAVGYLKARGRSRIAVIGYPQVSDRWRQEILAAGLTTRPWWQLNVDIHNTNPCRGVAQLLFNPTQGERPDGLIIDDDNVVEAFTRGIVDAGVDVPRDLDIIAHANYPVPPKAAVPVRYLGYDMEALLEAGLDALRDLRNGLPPRHVVIPARFADELTG